MVICLPAYDYFLFSVHFLSCIATFDSRFACLHLVYFTPRPKFRVGEGMLLFAFLPATLHVVETCTMGVKQGWGSRLALYFFFQLLLVLSHIGGNMQGGGCLQRYQEKITQCIVYMFNGGKGILLDIPKWRRNIRWCRK